MRIFIFLLASLLLHITLDGQDCGCDHVISQSGIYTQSTSPGTFNRNILPGQTVCIMSGNYTLLRFRNFTGSASQPIIFKNCGGLVTIGHGTYYAALDFQGCRYFHVTGAGDPAETYGIRIDSCGTASAMSVGVLSSDCEIDHIEVAKAGFAGMMVKTDPGCDAATWRENFTMYNVNIHDNYVHDVGGEGFYVGNSFFGSGMTRTCDGVSMQVYPHDIVGLSIHHNIVRNSGAECLQYACAPDAEVYNNDLENCGIDPFASYQNNGLQCGGGAGGNCYNNRVKDMGGAALIVIGHLGNNRFYNNLLMNSGGDGIFCDERTGSIGGTYCDFINNTVVNSGRDAIRLYNQDNTIVLANNAFVGTGLVTATGTCVVLQQGAVATQLNNYCSTAAPSTSVFDDLNTLVPLPGGPLTDAGADVSAYGVTFDMAGNSRPYGAGYDIGAIESQEVSLTAELLMLEGYYDDGSNYIRWELGSTAEIEAIILERATTFPDFIPLSQCSATQQSAEDRSPRPRTWYRLKLVHTDGTATYSRLLLVKAPENIAGPSVQISPNPTHGVVHIQLAHPASYPVPIALLRADGTRVMNAVIPEGTSAYSFDLRAFPAGIYYLLADGQRRRVVKE